MDYIWLCLYVSYIIQIGVWHRLSKLNPLLEFSLRNRYCKCFCFAVAVVAAAVVVIQWYRFLVHTYLSFIAEELSALHDRLHSDLLNDTFILFLLILARNKLAIRSSYYIVGLLWINTVSKCAERFHLPQYRYAIKV